MDPASGAPVADKPYQLDGVFDQGEDTAAVYEQTTKGLVKHVRRLWLPPSAVKPAMLLQRCFTDLVLPLPCCCSSCLQALTTSHRTCSC